MASNIFTLIFVASAFAPLTLTANPWPDEPEALAAVFVASPGETQRAIIDKICAWEREYLRPTAPAASYPYVAKRRAYLEIFRRARDSREAGVAEYAVEEYQRVMREFIRADNIEASVSIFSDRGEFEFARDYHLENVLRQVKAGQVLRPAVLGPLIVDFTNPRGFDSEKQKVAVAEIIIRAMAFYRTVGHCVDLNLSALWTGTNLLLAPYMPKAYGVVGEAIRELRANPQADLDETVNKAIQLFRAAAN